MRVRFASLEIGKIDRRHFLGIEAGSKTTLQVFLKQHGPKLSAAFQDLSDDEKAALLSDFLEAKEEKGHTPKKLSNLSLSKIIDFRI
jgi:hypothetical protein